MRTRTRTVVIAAVGMLLGATATGHATPPGPGTGIQGCGYATTPDSTPGGIFGGPYVHNGVVYGGPIVIADLDDAFANAVDGRLTCTLIVNGGAPWVVLDSGTQSYLVANADQLQYTAAPGSDVLICGKLDLVNAHGETASYDLGCTRDGVVTGSGPACAVTQFLPAAVREPVESHLEC